METTNPVSSVLYNLICDSGLLPYAYSGRGMYGKQCLAFDVISGDSVYANLIEITCLVTNDQSVCEDAGIEWDDVINALKTATTDSMGRDTVVYFPNVPFVSPDVDD